MTMEIKTKTPDEYFALNLRPTTVFGSEGFVRLNEPKAAKVLCFTDGRVGLVAGVKDGVVRAPWSAPYFSIDTLAGVRESEITDFGHRLREFMAGRAFRLVTPPGVYGQREMAFVKGFGRPGDKELNDTSFAVGLREFSIDKWHENPRRSLRKAFKAGLRYVRGGDLATVYRFIAGHHRQLGYRMAMTESDVAATAKVVDVDVRQVLDGDRVVAATYCYRVRPDVVQLINCGDTPEGRSVGAMSFLIYSLLKEYKTELVGEKGFKDALFDYGPTSVEGEQNDGLARYKASVGCEMTPKLTLFSDGGKG